MSSRLLTFWLIVLFLAGALTGGAVVMGWQRRVQTYLVFFKTAAPNGLEGDGNTVVRGRRICNYADLQAVKAFIEATPEVKVHNARIVIVGLSKLN